MGILLLILLFAFAIIIHELGHMVVAKSFGVKVFKFSVGFGWRLTGKKIGETEYQLSAVPAGGYVQMKGMQRLEPIPPLIQLLPDKAVELTNASAETPLTPEEADILRREVEEENELRRAEHQEMVQSYHQAVRDNPEIVLNDCTDPDAFVNKPAWQRFLILIGGVSANLVCAFVFLLIACLTGYPVSTSRVTPIDKLPAAEAGLREGDRIVEINSARTKDLADVQRAIRDTRGNPITVVVERGGQRFTFTIVPRLVEGNWHIGVKSYGEIRKERLGVLDSVKIAGINTVVFPVKFAHGLYMTFSGKVKANDLAGPVGIVHIGSQVYAKRSLYEFLSFCGMLMAALFFFNLLPIPLLDGGHVLFLAIEKVRGKPVSNLWRNRVTLVFMILLIILSVYVCGNDISRACNGFQLPS